MFSPCTIKRDLCVIKVITRVVCIYRIKNVKHTCSYVQKKKKNSKKGNKMCPKNPGIFSTNFNVWEILQNKL